MQLQLAFLCTGTQVLRFLSFCYLGNLLPTSPKEPYPHLHGQRWVLGTLRQTCERAGPEHSLHCQPMMQEAYSSLPLTCVFIYLLLLFFFFFFCCNCGMQKFPGQGLNPNNDNARSFTSRPPGNSLTLHFWELCPMAAPRLKGEREMKSWGGGGDIPSRREWILVSNEQFVPQIL